MDEVESGVELTGSVFAPKSEVASARLRVLVVKTDGSEAGATAVVDGEKEVIAKVVIGVFDRDEGFDFENALSIREVIVGDLCEHSHPVLAGSIEPEACGVSEGLVEGEVIDEVDSAPCVISDPIGVGGPLVVAYVVVVKVRGVEETTVNCWCDEKERQGGIHASRVRTYKLRTSQNKETTPEEAVSCEFKDTWVI